MAPHNNDKNPSRFLKHPWPLSNLLWGLETLNLRHIRSHHGLPLYAGKSSPVFAAALEKVSHPHLAFKVVCAATLVHFLAANHRAFAQAVLWSKMSFHHISPRLVPCAQLFKFF